MHSSYTTSFSSITMTNRLMPSQENYSCVFWESKQPIHALEGVRADFLIFKVQGTAQNCDLKG